MKIFLKDSKIILLILFFILQICAPLQSEESKGFIYPQYSKTISMDFQEANLRDVLKVFSQQSGMNFIASEVVQNRKVTLYLDNVPVEEALEQILTANNLTYEMEPGSNIFIVKETGKPVINLITKVFFLKHATVSSSRISQEIINSIGSGSSGGSSGATVGIRDAILKVISENGKVTEDARTNSLTVTDVPSQFPVIEQTIARLDIAVPQVMIEVQMLDVSKDTAEKIGIKLGSTTQSWAEYAGGTRKSNFPFPEQLDPSKGIQPVYTLGTLTLAGLKAALDFINTKTDTKYLARPKLFTLSNQTAEIRITTQEAIGVKVTNTGGTELATQTSEAERTETGVSLRVTPQVNTETGEITMYIEPRVAQAKTGATFGTTQYKDPEERGTKSIVRIKDGETIMVGGLIRTDFSEVVTKLPFFGDIPFFGALFRHKNVSKNEDRELIVFITPHIAKEGAAAKQTTTVSIDREQAAPSAKKLAVDKTLADLENKRR